jgi:hypothetical protein
MCGGQVEIKRLRSLCEQAVSIDAGTAGAKDLASLTKRLKALDLTPAEVTPKALNMTRL